MTNDYLKAEVQISFLRLCYDYLSVKFLMEEQQGTRAVFRGERYS